ncbi:hypothetical protein [Roseibium sp. MMSF_3544]|uniref:hypothetical protein n=1 Tax=unclassified Roseibium TaxID=2629323 RepID=UPI00273DB74E|nr:hypothetical protein [Roseibium sp. MMSF_3544]
MSVQDFTKIQLEFLELFEIAARYDCLYLLDFHCFNMFNHDQTSLLTDAERAQLAAEARSDIFAEAIQRGFVPNPGPFGRIDEQEYLC